MSLAAAGGVSTSSRRKDGLMKLSDVLPALEKQNIDALAAAAVARADAAPGSAALARAAAAALARAGDAGGAGVLVARGARAASAAARAARAPGVSVLAAGAGPARADVLLLADAFGV